MSLFGGIGPDLWESHGIDRSEPHPLAVIAQRLRAVEEAQRFGVAYSPQPEGKDDRTIQ